MSNGNDKLDTCGCCDGVEWLTPRELSNDPGLNALLYRVGTHSAFKESMIRSLSVPEQTKAPALGTSPAPRLQDLSTREDDDPSIALIDAWAMVLDVLTFYQERIINEGYLRTALERLSLVELAKHISYRPKPGLAAETRLAFLTESAPGSPLEVEVDAGTQVQSIPGKDELPQIFETLEKFLARTAWNAMRPQLRQAQSLAKGLTHLYLEGTDNQLEAGDHLLMIGKERLTDTGSERWDLRVIESVTQDADRDLTLVTWREGLGHENPLTNPGEEPLVYALRQRASIFGYNATDYRSLATDIKTSFDSDYDSSTKDWDSSLVIDVGDQKIFLDRDYPDILVNSWIVLVKPSYAELYRAQEVRNDSVKAFTLSGKSTQIVLDTNEHLHYFHFRDALVLAESEALTMAEAPILLPVFGKTITFQTTPPPLSIGQRLVVEGETVAQLKVTERKVVIRSGSSTYTQENKLYLHAGGSTIELKAGSILELRGTPERLSDTQIKWTVAYEGSEGTVTAGEDDLVPYAPPPPPDTETTPNTLNQPTIVREVVEIADLVPADKPTGVVLKEGLEQVYWRDTVEVNANVAYATHGETKSEILGSGDGALRFQKFTLKQKPLTYVPSSTASGAENTLEVRVNDILWKEVSSLYGKGPDDKVYIVRGEDDGSTYIQFGDGITGARLPTGVENVKATYRVGIGFEGNLKAEQLAMLLTPQLGLKSVSNPLPSSGADEPESPEDIRDNAPLTVLTLDRVVSLQDFEDFAAAYLGIGKARADLLWQGEDRVVHLTVAAAATGAVSDDLRDRLIKSIDQARHKNFPVVVNSYEEIEFGLVATIIYHPDHLPDKVKSEVQAALTAAFDFSSRRFGQDVTPSEVIAIMQGVDGVLGIDLDKLDGQDPFAEEHFRLRAEIARWSEDESTILPAQLLLLDPDDISLSAVNDEDK